VAEEATREEFDRQLARKTDTFKALADGYSFIHGQEQVRALAAMTFGDILQTRIDEIQGPHPTGLPSRLEEVDAVKAEFNRVIEQLAGEERESPT
jgi:hypothetical protein